MYYNNTNNSNNISTSHNEEENHHSGPLFSQPLDPTTLIDGAPTNDFIQEFDLNHYDTSNVLFNDTTLFNNHHFDFYPPTMDPTQQEAILLSDPNFLRQHQLLQDQQKEMHHRLLNGEEKQVSNLSAMFDQEESIKMESNEEKDKQKQKKNNNRKQHVLIKNEEEQEDKVDHQRRFNELQARFRVNYARKSTSQQSQQQSVKTSINNNTSHPTHPTHPTTTTTATTTTNNNNHHHTNNTNNEKSIPITMTTAKLIPALNDKPSSTIPISSSPVTIGGLVMTNNEENNNELLSSSFPSRTMPIQIQRVPRNHNSQPFDAESHQKQLDNQLDKVDFNDITVSELKEMLRQRGKPATGKKAVLLQRLLEEREIAKGNRSGGRILSNRHSQPLPFSRSVTNNNNYVESPQRPRSFGGTSPVTIQESSFNSNNSFMASPSSPSTSNFLPSSPSGSLHRSIANMHIGSPPAAAISSRRYSPYSPRLSSSPKPSHQEYSSSVPLSAGSLSCSPVNTTNTIPSNNNNNNNMMLSASFSARSSRYYNNPKTYKPFTSSALATPDREEDVNPFDSYYNGGGDPPIKEEDDNHRSDCMINNSNNTMDWMDPNAFDMLLQQQQQQVNMNDIGTQLPQLTNEQIIALLNNQQQQQTNSFEFKLEDNSFNPQQQQSYYHHHQ